jgi:glycolate oxidase iron-sulfur subunit
VYHELIEQMRQRLEQRRAPSLQTRLMRGIFFHVFTRPTRLKLALLPVRLMQKIRLYGVLRRIGLMRLLPGQLQKMEQMLPEDGVLWPRAARGCGPRGAARRVAFFSGCVGSVMYDQVNRQAIELLAHCGVEVIVPQQACCGAIHHHNASERPAMDMARRNIDAFMPEGDPEAELIVTTIAGCGAMLREYDQLLRDDPVYAQRARRFVGKVRDVCEALLELGLGEPAHEVPMQATYHDACHLAHAQKVTMPPRQLLSRVKGLTLRPLPESDICCGAAGTYNLTQPAMARELAGRKLANISATGARVCITGNVGCAMHIQSQARLNGQDLRVLHPVQVLHAAHLGHAECVT